MVQVSVVLLIQFDWSQNKSRHPNIWEPDKSYHGAVWGDAVPQLTGQIYHLLYEQSSLTSRFRIYFKPF